MGVLQNTASCFPVTLLIILFVIIPRVSEIFCQSSYLAIGPAVLIDAEFRSGIVENLEDFSSQERGDYISFHGKSMDESLYYLPTSLIPLFMLT